MITDTQFKQDGSLASAGGLPPLDTYLAAGRARGILWTSLRQQVLELLWRSGKAWGAYGLADEMRRTGNSIFATSLYRILDTLERARLIVSIPTSRRVQISPNPAERHWAVLRCSGCEQVELVLMTRQANEIREIATRHGYATEQVVMECVGLCRSCAATTSGGDHPERGRSRTGSAAIT